MPIGYLHHDDRINPRNIGPNLSKLLTEFDRGRPQLHVSLAWVVSADQSDTIQAGRVGLVLDGGIGVSAQELATFGFKRGRKREGYRGDYYTLPA